jgi:hypothetical protein
VRVTPDDEVYRVNTVWLGPSGLTFPWTARYLAYATWLITFLVVLFVEAITPLTVHIPPNLGAVHHHAVHLRPPGLCAQHAMELRAKGVLLS